MVFDATPGSATATSYVSLAAAQSYLDQRQSEEIAAWTGASANQQERALMQATARLERLLWLGSRPNATQALAWPRGWGYYGYPCGWGGAPYDPAIVPPPIQWATVDLALSYLQSGPGEPGMDLAGFAGVTSVSLGPLSFSKGPSALADQDLPASVLQWLTGYLAAAGGTFRLARS